MKILRLLAFIAMAGVFAAVVVLAPAAAVVKAISQTSGASLPSMHNVTRVVAILSGTSFFFAGVVAYLSRLRRQARRHARTPIAVPNARARTI